MTRASATSTTSARCPHPASRRAIRSAPLAYQTDGDRLILIAANIGATRSPDWYHNLVAHPRVTVEIGTETLPATATIVEGEAREHFLARARASWAEAIEVWPELADLPAEEERRIPVIALALMRAEPGSSAG